MTLRPLRRPVAAVLVALPVLALAACSGAGPVVTSGTASPAASATIAPSASAAAPSVVASPTVSIAPSASPSASPALESPVEGVIVKLDTQGLTDVRGFNARLDDGEVITFALGRLENATEFPPGHLPEHMAASDRLRIWFRPADGKLVVYRIEHAD